jgi:hypothetical protein
MGKSFTADQIKKRNSMINKKKKEHIKIEMEDFHMSRAKEIIGLVEEEDDYLDDKFYSKGTYVYVKPTASGVKDSYPAANWINNETKVKLLDDAVQGTLDVSDVELEDGTEESIYGFNIVGEA